MLLGGVADTDRVKFLRKKKEQQEGGGEGEKANRRGEVKERKGEGGESLTPRSA